MASRAIGKGKPKMPKQTIGKGTPKGTPIGPKRKINPRGKSNFYMPGVPNKPYMPTISPGGPEFDPKNPAPMMGLGGKIISGNPGSQYSKVNNSKLVNKVYKTY